eukprot:TRINITY_DN26622_c0_g1_i1.p1 TRINITY_DN26622_c0_g1~~TRINITY_DN26622_c0_g1_i1.p1  ORF type:complete len:286 (+),score=32.02 TRINITY_DN26622_c0_g1_i1:117-974(+)
MLDKLLILLVFASTFYTSAFAGCQDHNNTAVDTQNDCISDREFCYFCKINSTSYCNPRDRKGCDELKKNVDNSKCEPFTCQDPTVPGAVIAIVVVVLFVCCCVIPGLIIFFCVRYCRRKRAKQNANVIIQSPADQQPGVYGQPALYDPPPNPSAVYPNQTTYPNQAWPAPDQAGSGPYAYPVVDPAPAPALTGDFYWHPSWGPRPSSLGTGPTPKYTLTPVASEAGPTVGTLPSEPSFGQSASSFGQSASNEPPPASESESSLDMVPLEPASRSAPANSTANVVL